MSKDYNRLAPNGGAPHRSLSEITADRQRGQSSIHRTGYMPGKASGVKKPTTLSHYHPTGIRNSLRWMKKATPYQDKYEKLRLESADVTGKLDKVQADLKKAKAKLEIKEAKSRLHKRFATSISTAEEKISKAMEDLAARENLAAARREKKDARLEIWEKKQVEDYEKREARRQEHARLPEGDQGPEMVGLGMTGAVVATEAVEDEFDIDIYSD